MPEMATKIFLCTPSPRPQAGRNPVIPNLEVSNSRREDSLSPLLTQVYLENHTLEEAVAHGIDVPMQLASE